MIFLCHRHLQAVRYHEALAVTVSSQFRLKPDNLLQFSTLSV